MVRSRVISLAATLTARSGVGHVRQRSGAAPTSLSRAAPTFGGRANVAVAGRPNVAGHANVRGPRHHTHASRIADARDRPPPPASSARSADREAALRTLWTAAHTPH